MRAIRLLLASGFLAAVAHIAPVAERAALGITRVEVLAPEAIARPLGGIRAAGEWNAERKGSGSV